MSVAALQVLQQLKGVLTLPSLSIILSPGSVKAGEMCAGFLVFLTPIIPCRAKTRVQAFV